MKDSNSQSLATQAKEGEHLVFTMPATKKSFDLLGDVIVELSTENVALKDKRGSNDEKWLDKSETRLLRQIDDKKEHV